LPHFATFCHILPHFCHIFATFCHIFAGGCSTASAWNRVHYLHILQISRRSIPTYMYLKLAGSYTHHSNIDPRYLG
jgi:hypothetical protein